MDTESTDEELTPLEDQFVQEYLLEPNGTRAYLRAARKAGRKLTNASAAVLASRLLRKVKVQQELQRARTEYQESMDLNATRVLNQLMTIAFSDPSDILNATEDGRHSILPIDQMPPTVRSTIASIDLKNGEVVRIKFESKLKAIDMLADHLGLLKPGKALEDLLFKLNEMGIDKHTMVYDNGPGPGRGP